MPPVSQSSHRPSWSPSDEPSPSGSPQPSANSDVDPSASVAVAVKYTPVAGSSPGKVSTKGAPSPDPSGAPFGVIPLPTSAVPRKSRPSPDPTGRMRSRQTHPLSCWLLRGGPPGIDDAADIRARPVEVSTDPDGEVHQTIGPSIAVGR